MNDELQKALKKYYDMFGDGFPTIPLFWGGTEEEHLKMVNECIKQKKTASQMGYYEEPTDGLLY